MLPTISLYQNAQKCAEVICHILSEEMKLQLPQRLMLTEHGQYTWLLAVMDDLNLGGSMEKYVNPRMLHRLSTALDGLPVVLSNHSGLRYAVLLSEKPRLPQSVEYPTVVGTLDTFPLGVSLTGPVHIHARQIVNMIVVGAQDSGKSMLLRSLAHTALMHGSELYLADPVQHTFNPDLWGRVATVVHNKSGVLQVLDYLRGEISRRAELFRSVGAIPPADIDEYNRLTNESLPRVWLIVDEANTFLAVKAVQEQMGDPARIGRKYGVHLVLAGHDWHEYTVSRELTGYFETRLCLRTPNDTTGRIVLDDVARGKRTMTFRQPGRAILRLRGQFMDLQLYNVIPERETGWIALAKARTSPDLKEVPIVQDEPAVVNEIAEMAETIRAKWALDMSRTQTAKLLGYPQYGGSYKARTDLVFDHLTATTTTTQKEPKIGGFASEMA